MAKRINRIGNEAINNRVKKMVTMREEMMQYVDQLHVRLMKGNSKTGKTCWTTSLIPIADCVNCSECRKDCYDVRNVCYLPAVQTIRATNSAIHKADPVRYWREVGDEIKSNNIEVLRINVGGDLTDEDFALVSQLGNENSQCSIMFFTKNYKGIAKFLNESCFPSNVKRLLSVWRGMELYNPHNLPVSHVLYEDGFTTAPEYGSFFCKGNCSDCFMNEEGCWNLQEGESVIFKEH